MKIRTQLVLASFLLSVLPLSGIVIYSYFSSRRAVEAAYQREASRVAQQMDRRLSGIRHDLEQRVAALSGLQGATNGDTPDVRNVMLTMADAASLVDSVEIRPAAQPEPTMIDLPPAPALPRMAMTHEQKDLIDRISSLGAKLGRESATMPAEQRQQLETAIHEAQSELDASFKARAREWEAEAAARVRAVPSPPAAPQEPQAPVIVKRTITEDERQELREKSKRIALLFGHNFDAAIRRGGAVVGHVSAQVSAEEVIDRVLGAASDDRSEIAFAVDREGNVYARSGVEKQKLIDLGIPARVRDHQSLRGIPNWVVVATTDPQSGIRVGVARPIGENFDEMRKTAAKNFGYGIALVFVALIGMVPLANHMTRDVNLVTRGAERVAQGDLMTRLPVKSKNEFGQLAAAFNRMAEDLSLHQQRIVEQEVQQQLLARENNRKTDELEDARRFQLSLLPKDVPKVAPYDIAVFTRTATEVGGDYYDFHVDGALSITVGDATGHGAKAGTMVTVIKTLFAGYTAKTSPACFLRDAAEKVKRMDLGRMAMALLVARFDRDRLTVASAGMPPVYVHRAATGELDEIARGATPLGTLGADYADVAVGLASGDTVFLITDGFPELVNAAGHQLGYSVAMDEFRAAAQGKSADDVIASLTDSVRKWHGEQPPNDDVTFVVVRMA